MTRDDIIKLAREAGFDPHDMSSDFTCNLMDIEHFAELVAAAEREACAKVCENGTFLHDFSPEAKYSRACARGIRARGQV